ncbi:MAG: hypothetical protein KF819_09490 [Labilithrix sp.]|nr:hypothetical protein [Labilithrix sp.]
MAQRDLQAESPPAAEGATARRPPRARLGSAILRAARSPKARLAIVRRALVPLLLALVPFFWVADATHRSALTTLGRDQGIFQYIGWAVGQGEVDYRDIRDVNGPLVHLIHKILLALGGADEHRFHVLELFATGVSFAFVGACLPSLVARRKPRGYERAAWAAAAWVVLGAQYHLYLYWNQAQRESFCDWFLLPSLALQLVRPAREARAASRRIVAIAALSTITWFGKPSFVLFTVMQLGVLLIDREVTLSAKQKIARFALGGALGAAIPIAYLLRWGDIGAFARITFIDVPQIYRFIWAKSAQEIFGEEGPLKVAAAGLAAAALLIGLVATRELPRRVLVVALAPLCGIVNVVVQHKGFGYHFHPVTATTHFGFLIVVAMLWERFRGAPRKRPLGRHAAVVVAVAYALEVTSSMKGSPHIRNVWILAGGETPERRMTEEYFNSFKSHDFFPWEMRLGASWLRSNTSPDARVQVYGMDPYILFLAQRRSATPYIYAYDLNDDAALEGGWSNRPTERDVARIKAARDAHEHDMLTRLRAAPPEAFVFIDKSPLISYQDAMEDFRHCCKESAEWVASNYHQAQSFGEVHVWLRDDLRR